jgi:CRISPR-associated protein Cas1
MDIGYTYLFSLIEAMLNLYGFDLYKGVLHQCFYQRKSLVCDLVEPFRCIIDYQLRKADNLGQIKKEDFIEIKGQYKLSYEKSKIYTKWLLHALLKQKEAMFYYTQEYYRWFMKNKSLEEFPYFKWQ